MELGTSSSGFLGSSYFPENPSFIAGRVLIFFQSLNQGPPEFEKEKKALWPEADPVHL